MQTLQLSDRWLGLIAVNIAAVLFGAIGLVGMLNISPTWIVFSRAVFASATLYIWAQIRKEPIRLERVNKFKLIFSGGLLTIHWMSFFVAVKASGIAVATLTFSVFPLFTIFFENLREQKWPKRLELLCGTTIVFAVALLMSNTDATNNSVLASETTYGAICGIISAATFAGFGLLSQDLTRVESARIVAGFQNIIVCIWLLPFLFVSRPLPATAWDFAVLATLGIIMTAIVHQLYFFALRRLPANVCGGFVALEPVYAILLAMIFFGEPLSVHVFVSGLLIIAASILLLRVHRSH